MIRSAITVSLVEEARGGPFVYWDGLEHAFSSAAALGYDAIEIFAPGPEAVSASQVRELCQQHQMGVAAVGTGAGMVKHGLSLTAEDPDQRRQALEFVRSMIDFGAQFSCPAIIGSMQGRWNSAVSRSQALQWLGEGLRELGRHAATHQVPLIYEPLNRYETNLFCTLGSAAEYLQDLGECNVKLLADLFHMNIEESDIAAAIMECGDMIGHLHFVDSNRQAAGRGHMDYAPIATALGKIGFAGYASAEAFPLPDSQAAAVATMETFRRFFR